MTVEKKQEASSGAPSFLVHALFATGRNGEMGNKDGSLPWRTCNNRIRSDLPENIQKQCSDDMVLFKKLTTGNIVIMGYNTYKTFPYPLPNRINIVIDRNTTGGFSGELSESGWNFFPTLETALEASRLFNESSEKEKRGVFIIGGVKLLKEAFDKKVFTGNIYHTTIDADFPEASVIFRS